MSDSDIIKAVIALVAFYGGGHLTLGYFIRKYDKR